MPEQQAPYNDTPLTITVDPAVISHVIALALLGAQTYLSSRHFDVADRDINAVQREVLSAKEYAA